MQAVVRFFSIVLLALALQTNALAQEVEVQKIKAQVKEVIGVEPSSVILSPVKGLYEVTVPPRVFYISADARFLMSGSIYDLQTKTNLTEEKLSDARVASLDEMGETSMIVFAPEKVKHTISVFTDIDCGYCRKLHSEMAKYNELGIKIRYLAYPRAGIGSESYNKAVSVWCAEDRNQAMTNAKKGGKVPDKKCTNPVAAHYQLGQELGINGTPALMLENGQIYPGYVPADKLITVLDKVKTQVSKK